MRTEPAHFRSLSGRPAWLNADIILEALAEFRDPSETTPSRWPGQAAPEYQLSRTQPVAAMEIKLNGASAS